MGKISQFMDFIKHGVWQKDGEEDNGENKVRWYVRPFRILIYTVKGLGEHGVGVRAAGLSFFTLTAIVPVFAVIYAVIKGFGMQETLTEYLYEQFGPYRELIDTILEFAGNMLSVRTSGGLIAGFGLVILFWSVIQVFGNIENAFNNIWEVKHKRSMGRKFSDYITVIIIAPILWIISRNLVSYIRTGLEPYAWSWLLDILFGLLALMAIWLIFAFIYYVMPNTRVKFKGALIAGIIAGTLFQVFQLGYTWLQGYLTAYNVIYGSFAALPLFLIWLQWSWMILLVGAELSFAYQNISKYEQERESMNMCYDRRRKVMLAAMVTIVKHFLDNKGPVNSEQVADELNMPVRIVRDVIYDLENAGLVLAVKDEHDDRRSYFIPARDVHTISVYDVVEGVECNSNANLNVNFRNNRKIDRVSEVLDGVKAVTSQPPYNVPITDLIVEDE